MLLYYLGKHQLPKFRLFNHAVYLMVCKSSASRCMIFIHYCWLLIYINTAICLHKSCNVIIWIYFSSMPLKMTKAIALEKWSWEFCTAAAEVNPPWSDRSLVEGSFSSSNFWVNTAHLSVSVAILLALTCLFGLLLTGMPQMLCIWQQPSFFLVTAIVEKDYTIIVKLVNGSFVLNRCQTWIPANFNEEETFCCNCGCAVWHVSCVSVFTASPYCIHISKCMYSDLCWLEI